MNHMVICKSGDLIRGGVTDVTSKDRARYDRVSKLRDPSDSDRRRVETDRTIDPARQAWRWQGR